MARSVIPDPIERRHQLERSLSADAALRIAQAYLEAERPVEALAFLAKAEARDEIEKVVAGAVERGDAFLLKSALVELGRDATRAEWQALAGAAEAAGRVRYVEMARRQLELGD